ncbi:hypothetical protein AAHC03_01036 [Spirometra sp. Aus1]
MFEDFGAYLFFGLAIVPITAYFNQFLFFIFAFYVSSTKFYRRPSHPLQHFPGVTIVKPLMGLDPLLRENLVSHMELNYPNFEIVFCVESPDDPALDLVQSLLREYPNVDARLIVGGSGNIVNPMVNNLLPGYESAKYDLIWISTSRIRVHTQIMEDLVRKSKDPSVALVHQLPFYNDQRGFTNALEKVCFACSLGRSSISLNFMGVLCFTGMSYLVKKSILDKYGGYAYFGKYLAEDFFLSKELHKNGYKIVMSDFPAQQNVAGSSLSSYVARMVRWLRLRLNMLPIVAAVFEPMIECLNLGVLISLSLNYLFGFRITQTFFLHVCVWILLDYILLRLVQNGPLPFSFPTFLLAWWTRELLTYVIYVKAMIHPRTVKWGAHTYVLSLGGHTRFATDQHLPARCGGTHLPPVHFAATTTASPTMTTKVPTGNGGNGSNTSLTTHLSAAEKQIGISNGTEVQPNGGNMFTWRHFPPNGYIQGNAGLVRKVDGYSSLANGAADSAATTRLSHYGQPRGTLLMDD